ncbi:unnamed protein product [Tetraodon nigroviridis]|uniref:Chromosome undetermined SCAF14699, whole genome shotgun sequence n=1 Tax=Tetraodon nigroviridis TaxID=99883 RepID=Q4S9C7_TETNG|nr:unnamed protein product [Tetraodon nigroviridis]
MSMDTNSSSASSCGSDSGEDEVALGGPHPGAFAYRQQGQSQQSQASRSLVAAPTEAGCDSRMEEPAEQESWNCWNQNTEAYRHSPHVVNAAYRQEARGAPQQQRDCAPCSDPAGDAKPWHGFQRHAGSRGHDEPSSCPNGRTRLICPMNTSPYVSPNKSSQEIWEEFSMSFTPAVQEVVDFAKRIPGFRDLPKNDQVSLLKAGTFEVLMVRFASLFDAAERTLTFLSGKRYSLDTLCSLGAGELLLSMCEFSEKLAALRLDSEEMSLFTAVVLVSADRSGIQDLKAVEALQDQLIRALRNLIAENHGDESATTFTKLLLKRARAALAQQPALGGAALLQSSPVRGGPCPDHTPAPVPASESPPPPPPALGPPKPSALCS